MGHPLLYVTFSICSSICCAPYLRNCTSSNHNFWYTCGKWWYLQVFFSFFWNFGFLGCYGGKRAKNNPKWKITITYVNAISQEQYSIWSWFLIHLCKMMISPGFFFIFLKFSFLGCYGGKRAKNSLKWKGTIACVTHHISGTV